MIQITAHYLENAAPAAAQALGKSIVAVDPTRIRIFQPDAQTIEILHSMQTGSERVTPPGQGQENSAR
jgi:hypothetical protein